LTSNHSSQKTKKRKISSVTSTVEVADENKITQSDAGYFFIMTILIF
jgi:hypothetical protein